MTTIDLASRFAAHRSRWTTDTPAARPHPPSRPSGRRSIGGPAHPSAQHDTRDRRDCWVREREDAGKRSRGRTPIGVLLPDDGHLHRRRLPIRARRISNVASCTVEGERGRLRIVTRRRSRRSDGALGALRARLVGSERRRMHRRYRPPPTTPFAPLRSAAEHWINRSAGASRPPCAPAPNLRRTLTTEDPSRRRNREQRRLWHIRDPRLAFAPRFSSLAGRVSLVTPNENPASLTDQPLELARSMCVGYT